MRLAGAVILVLAFAGCASTHVPGGPPAPGEYPLPMPDLTLPDTVVRLTPAEQEARDAPTSFDCALQLLVARQYVPTAMDRDGGFVRAERRATSAAAGLLTRADFYDEITVLAVGDQLQVTPRRTRQVGSGSRTAVGQATPRGTWEDASRIKQLCRRSTPTR